MASSAVHPEAQQGFPHPRLAAELAGHLPGLKMICRVDKGWSSDEKAMLQDSSGASYLLRCSSEVPIQRRAVQADAMQKASAAGMLCTMPVRFGDLPEGGSYILQTWLHGEELEGILASSAPSACYELGRLAGRALRSVHRSTMAPPTDLAFIKAARRIERHIDGYEKSGFSEPWEKVALSFIREHICLLKARPASLRHGDFHPGNMVISSGNRLGIIDFDRCDFGDPYDEFYKAEMFTRQLSVDFTNGQIHEYFEGDPPAAFWNALKLYLADVILHSLVWALPFGEAEVEGMRCRARAVLADFDNLNSLLPSWYRRA